MMMREFANENGLMLVDLFDSSKRFFESLSPAAATSYYASKKDVTHFSRQGAGILAQMVVDSLTEQQDKNPRMRDLFLQFGIAASSSSEGKLGHFKKPNQDIITN